MRLFRKKPSHSELVSSGRFELERDGHVAFLDYTLSGDVLGLVHTEVPEPLRSQGLASELAKTALEWARANHKKVDVICPTVAAYLKKHPEYSDLLLQ